MIICEYNIVDQLIGFHVHNTISQQDDPPAAYCGEPMLPPDGILSASIFFEPSVIHYRCRDGLHPVQEMRSECTMNGVWIPDPSKLLCVNLNVNSSDVQCVSESLIIIICTEITNPYTGM